MVRRFKAAGLDFIGVGIGFSTPAATIPWGPAFMVPVAQRIRRETGMPAATSWFISVPAQADALIADDKTDLVPLRRPPPANPSWPYRAVTELRIEEAAWTLPAPYAHWLERYRAA